MKAAIKHRLLPRGQALRRIRGGVARGCFMHLNLCTQLQRYWGLDERELAPVVRKLINGARSLIDVGANDGLYTLAFLASNAIRVVACEPGSAADQLLANASNNGHELSSRFQLERRLIGNRPEEISLMELMNPMPTPVFVKIDVDGVEDEVLKSAEHYQHLDKVSWIIETHSARLEANCIDWFATHGYRSDIIFPAWWRAVVPEQRPLEHNRWLVAIAA